MVSSHIIELDAVTILCTKIFLYHIFLYSEVSVRRFTIDVIEAWNLDFSLGNAVKYIARAGKKDPGKRKQDLEKAIWYIERTVSNLR